MVTGMFQKWSIEKEGKGESESTEIFVLKLFEMSFSVNFTYTSENQWDISIDCSGLNPESACVYFQTGTHSDKDC